MTHDESKVYGSDNGPFRVEFPDWDYVVVFESGTVQGGFETLRDAVEWARGVILEG